MITRLCKLTTLLLCSVLLTTACKKDRPEDIPVPDPQPEPIAQEIDEGPKDEDHDFYVAMSYTDEQPSTQQNPRYYILVTCTDSLQSIETIEIKIQDQVVDLEYANYGGEDFYIAYFNREFTNVYNYKLTINDETTEYDLDMIQKLYIEYPGSLLANKDLELRWATEVDPQFTYIEGFQREVNQNLIQKNVENLAPEMRSFTMPASWLWSDDSTKIRDIQLGIMNYGIQNRVCFTMSDGAFVRYQN